MGWFFGPFFLFFWIVAIAGIALWIWALVDCVQVPDDAMYQSGNKLIWVLIIVLAQFIGAILYLLIGRPKPGAQPGAAGGGARQGGPPPPPPPGGSAS